MQDLKVLLVNYDGKKISLIHPAQARQLLREKKVEVVESKPIFTVKLVRGDK